MSRYKSAYKKYAENIVGAMIADKSFGIDTLENFGAGYALQTARKDRAFRKRLRTNALTTNDHENVIKPVFDAFSYLTDPSADNNSKWKYLDWVCKTFAESHEGNDKVSGSAIQYYRGMLSDFEALKNTLPVTERDIYAYKTAADLEKTIEPHREERAKRKAAQLQASEKVAAESTVIYQGEEGHIVVPQTQEACTFWAQQTKWCIGSSFFNSYNKKAPIVIFLPKPTDIEKECLSQYSSFKFCGTGGRFYDELDQQVNVAVPCLQDLFNAAAQNMELAENKRFLFRNGSLTKLKPSKPANGMQWRDKKEFLAAIKHNPINFTLADTTLKLDPDCIRVALKKSPELYKHVPVEGLEDEKIARITYKAINTIDRRDKLSLQFGYVAGFTATIGLPLAALGYALAADSPYSRTEDFIFLSSMFGVMGATLGGMFGAMSAKAGTQFLAATYTALTSTRDTEKIKQALDNNPYIQTATSYQRLEQRQQQHTPN